MRPSCDPHATLMRPSCDPQATLKPHQSHTKATPKPGYPSPFPFIREVWVRSAFSRSSKISSKCQPEPPYSADMMLLLLDSTGFEGRCDAVLFSQDLTRVKCGQIRKAHV